MENTEYRVCWVCNGLSSSNKSSPSQMEMHTKYCQGMDDIEVSPFDFFICNKADFCALSEIKQSLDKDMCLLLKSQDRCSQPDVPDRLIQSLLKLSISSFADGSKCSAELNSSVKVSPSIRELSEEGQTISPEIIKNYLSKDKSTQLPTSMSSDKDYLVKDILKLEEKHKLQQECCTVKSGNNEELQCKLCGYHSKSSKIMLRHLSSHDNGQAFHCEKCNFSTVMRHKWILHQSKHAEANILCHICSQRFKSEYKLDLHIATIHHELNKERKKQLQCDSCDYIGRDQGSLVEHKRKHTGEFLKCTLENCDFKTMYKRSLQKHLRQKHSENKSQKCQICDFQSRHASSLKKHMMIHYSDSKPHKCPECPYSSINNSDVVRHIESKHLKKKKYSCSKCPFQSSYYNGLKKHMASHERLEAEKINGKKNSCRLAKTLKINSSSVCGDILNDRKEAKDQMQKHRSAIKIVSGENGSSIPKALDQMKKDLSVPMAFHNKSINFDSLLDVEISNDVLDLASNILNAEVTEKDTYNSQNNVGLALPHEAMCQDVFTSDETKSGVSPRKGNPMLSATSDALGDIDSSLMEDSLFDLMSDFPRLPTLNRCQSASTLMFASLTQPNVDRPLTPDFFTDSPAQSFFQNFSSRSMDQDNFPNPLSQPFQLSTGFPSQIELPTARASKPVSPVLPNFSCFPASQNSPNIPHSEDTESERAISTITECLL